MCLSSVFLILYVSAVDAIFELFVYWNTHGSCEKDKMQKARQKVYNVSPSIEGIHSGT